LKKLIRSMLICSKRSDVILSITIYALLIFGLIVSTSAGINAKSTMASTFHDFARYLIVVVLSVVFYHLASNYFNINRFGVSRMYRLIAVEFILLIAAVVISNEKLFGPINGNYSWIHIPGIPFTFQPSELGKIVVILMIAVFFCDKRYKGITRSLDVVGRPLLVYFGFIAIIFFLQKDLGSAFVVAAIGLIVFLIPSHKLLRGWQICIVVMMVGAVGGYIFLLSEGGQQFLTKIGLGHVAARFLAVTNPSYTSDATREIFYSLLGISKGSLFGVGLGNSVQKFGYLVSSEADYIFAILAEELGLIGILAVFAGYGFMLFRLLHFARLVRKESEKAVLVGCASYLFIHFFLNVGGVSGLIPLTGVPLLLISRGGSALWSIMIALGMSQGVIHNYRTEKAEKRSLIA